MESFTIYNPECSEGYGPEGELMVQCITGEVSLYNGICVESNTISGIVELMQSIQV